jgi:hypothetical protein
MIAGRLFRDVVDHQSGTGLIARDSTSDAAFVGKA